MRRQAQVLFFFNAAIWLMICFWTLVRAQGGEQAITAWVITLLMLGNTAAFVIAGFGIGKSNRLFYYFGLAVLVVNILFTITDQFGMLDLITLIIDLVLLGVLITIRLKPAQWNYSR